jgi:hypothetical protein
MLIEEDVVAEMPRGPYGVGQWREIHIFKPDSCFYQDGRISDEALDQEYERLGLVPADMYSLAEANSDFELARVCPHGTHWKDETGAWCHGACVHWNGEDRIHVNRSLRGWANHWQFAGIKK